MSLFLLQLGSNACNDVTPDRSIKLQGPKIWNSLSTELRYQLHSKLKNNFKKHLIKICVDSNELGIHWGLGSSPSPGQGCHFFPWSSPGGSKHLARAEVKFQISLPYILAYKTRDVPNTGYISGIRHYPALFEVSGIRPDF